MAVSKSATLFASALMSALPTLFSRSLVNSDTKNCKFSDKISLIFLSTICSISFLNSSFIKNLLCDHFKRLQGRFSSFYDNYFDFFRFINKIANTIPSTAMITVKQVMISGFMPFAEIVVVFM